MFLFMVSSNLGIVCISVTLKSISDILLISLFISSVANVTVSEFSSVGGPPPSHFGERQLGECPQSKV